MSANAVCARISVGSKAVKNRIVATPANSSTSEAITVTVDNPEPPGPDTTPPSVPTGFQLDSASTTSLNLSWQPSTDPIVSGSSTAGISGYLIYRADKHNGSVPIAATDLTSFIDSGLSPDTSYTYYLAAIDNAGNTSNKSEPLTIKTAAIPQGDPPTLDLKANKTSLDGPGSVSLSWTSTKASTCSASGAWNGTKATAGSQSLTVRTSSTFVLSCSGPGGSAKDSVSIRVNNQPPPTKHDRGDLDNNGSIDIIDLSILLSDYGSHQDKGSGGDVNADGTVNIIDLSILLSNYGK